MSDWTVLGEKDDGTVVEKDATSRSDAEAKKEQAQDLELQNVEIVPPGDDGGDDMDVDVVEHAPDDDGGGYDLPDEGPSVDEDPLVWMPDEFTDTIDGTVAINRKGFEVLAHHYDISCVTEVSDALTTEDRVVFKATATDNDGDTYTAFGSGGAERGDSGRPTVEMADTRAYKRAVSRATGVGMIAVEELQNEL